MTTVTNPPATITQQKVDELCRAYEEKKRLADLATAAATEAKAALIDQIERFGYVPTNAEKSKRLDGLEKVATTTTSTSVEIKSDAVTRLQLVLSKLNKPRIFARLFARQVKYSLVKDGPDTLKIAVAGLPTPRRAEVLALFSSCFEVNSKAPSLSVDDAAVLKAKEEKAAKKAAKKGAAK